jgi:hypothetical protein
MIKGIKGHPYIDLSSMVDLTGFDKLHPEICKGFAVTKNIVPQGMLYAPEDYLNLKVYNNQFKMLFKAHRELTNLPDDHPIKVNATDLKENDDIARYLKFALGGYDLYSFYVLCDFEEGWRVASDMISKKPLADYFPGVIAWIDKLIEQQVFSHIGRATFFVLEAGGVSFEHHDPSLDPENPDVTSEFIHVRLNTDRPFYVRDSETLEKFYINTRVAYWNDQDYHGGDPVLKPSYSLRIDGVFTDKFKDKINEL